MATGGFKSNATTDFLEEWKAKREKMRAKMLGDIAAATGAPLAATVSGSNGNGSRGEPRNNATTGTELTNNGNPERGGPVPTANCVVSPCPVAVVRSSSGSALPKRPEEETPPVPHHPAAHPSPHLTPAQDSSIPPAGVDSDKESPSSGKGKEKKSSAGPSARKGKGQIEKRKLREKRRSTGVVSIPSNESLDELDDDDGGEKKERKKEEELVQANTFQNEAMTADPGAAHLTDTRGSGGGRHKSSTGPGSEEEAGGNSRPRHSRHGRDGAAAAGGLERRLEELEKELAKERQENSRLLKAHQDKDDLIGKLKEEIDLLNRDLDDIEDENEQLKQENKTLLKVVGQLTR